VVRRDGHGGADSDTGWRRGLPKLREQRHRRLAATHGDRGGEESGGESMALGCGYLSSSRWL